MEEGELVEGEVKVVAEVAVEMEVAAEVEMVVEAVVEAVPEEEVTGNNLAGTGETEGVAIMVLRAGSAISPKTGTLDKTPALEHHFHEMEAM